jgi:rhodanese-related sulfurtransferase
MIYMKTIMQTSLFILTSIFLLSCHRGYISSNGSTLKKYLSFEELKRITDHPDPNIWIIDLRPRSFYNRGHIPTAKSYPSNEIMSRLDELPKDKSLILYCVLSPGAQMTIKKLEQAGYTKNLNWGRYSHWPYKSE